MDAVALIIVQGGRETLMQQSVELLGSVPLVCRAVAALTIVFFGVL